MSFHVKLDGILHYANADAARAAHAAMMKGRDENWMLVHGARVDGSSIVFAFDNAISYSNASDIVDSTEFGIEKALESALTGSVTYSHEGGYVRVEHALGRPFWAKRWHDGETAFHEGAPNPLLVEHVARIEKLRPARMLVPLAGKAVDMRWLAERGHEIVGVDFAWEAVRGFFDDWELDPPITETGKHPTLSANGVTLVCGDMFDVSPELLGAFDVVYDRAALVALEPSRREAYVAACRAFQREGAVTLLIAISHDLPHGPPWSVDESMVRALHADRTVEVLGRRDYVPQRADGTPGPRLVETAYLITG